MQGEDTNYVSDVPAPKPKRQLKPTPRRLRKKIIVGIATVLLVVAAIVGGLYLIQPKSPIPKNVSQSVSFPIYYPSTLPDGYQLKKNSFNVQSDIVFYSLGNGNSTISISEQASPQHPPDLKSIPGFGEVPSVAGEAGAGLVNDLPVAIVITEKTMINIGGSKPVTRDLVAKIAQSMSAPSW